MNDILKDNKSHYVVIVYDKNGKTRLYIDGILTRAKTQTFEFWVRKKRKYSKRVIGE